MLQLWPRPGKHLRPGPLALSSGRKTAPPEIYGITKEFVGRAGLGPSYSVVVLAVLYFNRELSYMIIHLLDLLHRLVPLFSRIIMERTRTPQNVLQISATRPYPASSYLTHFTVPTLQPNQESSSTEHQAGSKTGNAPCRTDAHPT
jgi:hypothetical protein